MHTPYFRKHFTILTRVRENNDKENRETEAILDKCLHRNQ